MLPWYTAYIIVGLEWRITCMHFYALDIAFFAISYIAKWRVCLYSTKQQETKNIKSKRAKCSELEKRNCNVGWGVAAGREKERDEKDMGILWH